MNVTEKVSKTSEEHLQIPVAYLQTMMYPSFNEQVRPRLPSGYTESSMVIDDITRFYAVGYRRPACFCDVETDEKDEGFLWICLRVFFENRTTETFSPESSSSDNYSTYIGAQAGMLS